MYSQTCDQRGRRYAVVQSLPQVALRRLVEVSGDIRRRIQAVYYKPKVFILDCIFNGLAGHGTVGEICPHQDSLDSMRIRDGLGGGI